MLVHDLLTSFKTVDIQQGVDQTLDARRRSWCNRQHGLNCFILLHQGAYHFKARDNIAKRRANVVIDHVGHIVTQGIQLFALGNIAQDPLQRIISSNLTRCACTSTGIVPPFCLCKTDS